MKKISLFTFVLIVLVSCQPKDTQAPLIFLKGDNPMRVSLGKWFKDPGATAEDNKDKDITAKLTMTHNVDINGPTNGEGTARRVGSYTVTYTCKDAAGNVGTATRAVNIVNDVQQYATRYEFHVTTTNHSIVHDTTIASIDLTVDNSTNMKMWFPKLGGKTGLRIYGMVAWDTTDHYYHINLPDQKIPLYEGTTRYLFGVQGIVAQSKILDSIDPSIDVKYYLTKYRQSTNGTVIWPIGYPDSLWEVLKDDVVLDHYERY
jgi:hypothetical protein